MKYSGRPPSIAASKGPQCSVPELMNFRRMSLTTSGFQERELPARVSFEQERQLLNVLTLSQHPREHIITTHSHTGCRLSPSLTHYQHSIVDKATRFLFKSGEGIPSRGDDEGKPVDID